MSAPGLHFGQEGAQRGTLCGEMDTKDLNEFVGDIRRLSLELSRGCGQRNSGFGDGRAFTASRKNSFSAEDSSPHPTASRRFVRLELLIVPQMLPLESATLRSELQYVVYQNKCLPSALCLNLA